MDISTNKKSQKSWRKKKEEDKANTKIPPIS